MPGNDLQSGTVNAAVCEHCETPCAPTARFCCYGCELVFGLARRAGEEGSAARARAALCAFFAMNLMAVTMMLYVDDAYPSAVAGEVAPLREMFRWAAAAFATPIMLILAPPMARSAVARGESAWVDLLILLSTSAAYVASFVSLVRGTGPIYFEVAAMTLLLFCVGRSIEAVAKARAAALIAESMRPADVLYQRRDRDGRWLDVRRHEIEAGDLVRVPVGANLPVDGELLAAGSVDRSATTGESRSVTLDVGDRVFSGDIALGGALELRAAARPERSRMARLEQATRSAVDERGRSERMADAMARIVVPGALAIAAVTFGYWSIHASVEAGARATLAVLLCACPCAFGIATPLALRAALARATARGVMIRSAHDVERLAAVRAVVFDKTGTLTTKTILPNGVRGYDPDHAIAVAAALERAVQHPLGAELADIGPVRVTIEEVRSLAGVGVVGRLDGRVVAVGNGLLSTRIDVEDAAAPVVDDELIVVDDGRIVGRLATAERIRPGAHEAVAALAARGMTMQVLSGDHAAAVDMTASRLDLVSTSRMTPEAKQAAVRSLEAEVGPVMMVGDGVNDAPALSASSLGVAVADGSDLSRAVAPIVVDGADLRALPWAIDLARAAMRTVRGNLTWAIAYNAVCMAAAASGYLAPLLAAVAMAMSSIAVSANSARLLRFPFEPSPAARRVPAASELPAAARRLGEVSA